MHYRHTALYQDHTFCILSAAKESFIIQLCVQIDTQADIFCHTRERYGPIWPPALKDYSRRITIRPAQHRNVEAHIATPSCARTHLTSSFITGSVRSRSQTSAIDVWWESASDLRQAGTHGQLGQGQFIHEVRQLCERSIHQF